MGLTTGNTAVASHASTKDVATGFNNALFVSSRAYGEAGRLSLSSLQSADWDAPRHPADDGRIVNTEALITAYRAQAQASLVSGQDWPAAGHSQAASECCDLSSLARRMTDYQAQIERLETSSRSIAEQRDQWRIRAEQAEARIANVPKSSASPEDMSRYVALKHCLAKMLHPDSPSRSAEDKSACEALFVKIWAAIGQIEQPDTNDR